MRSPYSFDSGTQQWRRIEAPPTQSPDLWRDILGNRNTDGSLVRVGELRELIALIEPAMTIAEQRGVGLGADALWYPASWVWATTDRELAGAFLRLSAIKSRLDSLVSAGNRAAISDHTWVSMLLADVDEEVLRRIHCQGNKMIGDGNSIDALRNHSARNRGRLNWIITKRRVDNAGSAVWS